jgi:hypothetical protein
MAQATAVKQPVHIISQSLTQIWNLYHLYATQNFLSGSFLIDSTAEFIYRPSLE